MMQPAKPLSEQSSQISYVIGQTPGGDFELKLWDKQQKAWIPSLWPTFEAAQQAVKALPPSTDTTGGRP